MTGRSKWSASWAALALVVAALSLVPGGAAQADQRGAGVSNPLYDIKVKYGRSKPAVAGGSLKVKIKVHNLGSKPLEPQKLLVLLVGDKPVLARVGTRTIPANAARTTAVKVTIPAATKTGKRTLRACNVTRNGADQCGSIRSDAKVIVLPPARVGVSPTTFAFGATATGTQSTPKAFTLKNNGGVATSTISVNVTGEFAKSADTCSGHPLAAGATCTVDVTFNPTSVGTKSGTLVVTGSPGGSVTSSLSGTGVNPAAITFSPLQHPFGSVVTGAAASTTFTVTNTGEEETGVLTTSLTGTDADQFGTSDDDCDGQTLAGGASCVMTVSFAPTASGGKSASLQVTGTPGGSATAQLSGTGLNPAALAISPTQHAFGVRATGTVGSAKTFTVTNTGEVPTGSLTAALVDGDKDQFSTSDNTCDGQTLVPAATCSVTLSFAPTTTGLKSASLQVSATPGGSATASFSGTGATPATLAISPIVKDYGSVPVGASSSQAFTVTNTGGVPSGVPTLALESSVPGHFSITENLCGQALAAGVSCTVTVMFAPTSPGDRTAALNVSASPGGLASASLSGSGG